MGIAQAKDSVDVLLPGEFATLNGRLDCPYCRAVNAVLPKKIWDGEECCCYRCRGIFWFRAHGARADEPDGTLMVHPGRRPPGWQLYVGGPLPSEALRQRWTAGDLARATEELNRRYRAASFCWKTSD